MPINLQPVIPQDMATISSWAKDIDSGEFMSHTFPSISHNDHHDAANGLFWYLILENNLGVGTIWIEQIPGDTLPTLGIMLSSRSKFGCGIGKAAIKLAITEYRHIHTDSPISLNVRISNYRAIACYESIGFIITKIGYKLSSPNQRIHFYHMVLPQYQ